MKIFVDSSAFIAIYDRKDENHKISKQILSHLDVKQSSLLTTDYVFDESMTWFITHMKDGYVVALKFDKFIEINVGNLIFIDKPLFDKARNIYFKYNKDKIWSFTDCTSYVVMKELGIKRVFTFDEDFKQMGFWILKP